MDRTEIDSLGEFGLIEKLTQGVEHYHPETKLGIGDDAAVFTANKDNVISTDLLVEGVHFDLSYVPLKHLGFKAVAVNVSDIASMYAIPKQITVSISVSNRFSVEALEELYDGIKTACEAYKVDLVGGDTTSSRGGLVISVTAVGELINEKPVLRSGAKKGDVICLTGDVGAAYLGLQVMEREKQVFLANPDMQPDLEKYDYLVMRQLKPEARMDVIHALREEAVELHSMIDVSDGVASEIKHICSASKVGAYLYEEHLPIDKLVYDTALEFKIAPTTCALNGGEDYELMFTMNPLEYEKIKKHPDILAIGEVRDAADGIKLVSKENRLHDIQAQGWDHFSNEE